MIAVPLVKVLAAVVPGSQEALVVQQWRVKEMPEASEAVTMEDALTSQVLEVGLKTMEGGVVSGHALVAAVSLTLADAPQTFVAATQIV